MMVQDFGEGVWLQNSCDEQTSASQQHPIAKVPRAAHAQGGAGTREDRVPEVQGLLGGSWVVISGVISPLISVISLVTLLITPFITTFK